MCWKIFAEITDVQSCTFCHLLNDFGIESQSPMTIFCHINVGMHNILKVDKLKVSWDDNIRRFIHRKCH